MAANHRFGKTSRKRAETIMEDLFLILTVALMESQVDFGIAQGERTVDQQLQYFLEGNSRVDPRKYTMDKLVEVAKHICNSKYPKARAADIYVWVPGKKKLMYDEAHGMYLGGVITNVAKRLYELGKVKYKLRWGGNWDGDGELIYDQNLKDIWHYELVL